MRYLIACLISLGLAGVGFGQDMPAYQGKGKFRDINESEYINNGSTNEDIRIEGSARTEDENDPMPEYQGKGKFRDQSEGKGENNSSYDESIKVESYPYDYTGASNEEEMPEYQGKGKFRDDREGVSDGLFNNEVNSSYNESVKIQGDPNASRSDLGYTRHESNQTFNKTFDQLRQEGEDPYVKQGSELDMGSAKTVPDAAPEQGESENASTSSNAKMDMNAVEMGLNADDKTTDYKYKSNSKESKLKYRDQESNYIIDQKKNGKTDVYYRSGSEVYVLEKDKDGRSKYDYKIETDQERLDVSKKKNGSGKVKYEGEFKDMDHPQSEVFGGVDNIQNIDEIAD